MMGISLTPDEDDTRTVITMVLVSGEERVKLRAEEEHLRMRQPSPSRCSLLYTSRAIPGIDAGTHNHSIEE
jgi:hypothetical protein